MTSSVFMISSLYLWQILIIDWIGQMFFTDLTTSDYNWENSHHTPQWSLGNLLHPASLSIPTNAKFVAFKAWVPCAGLINNLSNRILGFLGYAQSRLSFMVISQVNWESAGLPHSSHASTIPLGNPPTDDTSASRRFVSPPNITVACGDCCVMFIKTCSNCLCRSPLHCAVLSRCEVIRINSVLFLYITGWQSRCRPILLDWKYVQWRSSVVFIDEFLRSNILKYAYVGPYLQEYLKIRWWIHIKIQTLRLFTLCTNVSYWLTWLLPRNLLPKAQFNCRKIDYIQKLTFLARLTIYYTHEQQPLASKHFSQNNTLTVNHLQQADNTPPPLITQNMSAE